MSPPVSPAGTAPATTPPNRRNRSTAAATDVRTWRCPRHAVECECAPPGGEREEGQGHGLSLEDMIRMLWRAESERDAVARKLREAGIRSLASLRKSLVTPVWGAHPTQVPSSCYFRGAPPLLNELIRERSSGSKLFRTSTLHAMAAYCHCYGDVNRIRAALTDFLEHEHRPDSGKVDLAVETLRASGLVALDDVIGALLLWEENSAGAARPQIQGRRVAGAGGLEPSALAIGGDALIELLGGLLCRSDGGCGHRILYSGAGTALGDADSTQGVPRPGTGGLPAVIASGQTSHATVQASSRSKAGAGDTCGVRRFLAHVNVQDNTEKGRWRERARLDAAMLPTAQSVADDQGRGGSGVGAGTVALGSGEDGGKTCWAQFEEAYSQHAAFVVNAAVRLAVAVSAASDSEGAAHKTLERLSRVGIRGPWELELALHCCVCEVHPADKSIGDNATVLNQLLSDRLGRAAMLSWQLMHRMRYLLAVESADGASGLIFTAPHGIWVQRPGHADHKPEVYTTFLAVAMAATTDSSFAVWSSAERCKSDLRGRPDQGNVDPNFAAGTQLEDLPWNRLLARHLRRFRAAAHAARAGTCAGLGKPRGFVGLLHVDLHGRRDSITGGDGSVDVSDCDIGVGALLHLGLRPEDCAMATRLAGVLFDELSRVFADSDFRVNMDPRLTGYIDDGGHLTMTMQAVTLGLRAVQLELSLRLRRALRYDHALRSRFAAALRAAAACDEIVRVDGGKEVEQESCRN